MKILLVVPRYSLSNKTNYNYILPIGLGYIYSVLKQAGHEVKGLNLNHLNGSTEEIITRILNKEHFDVVGTGNNALGYAVTEKIIKTARTHPSKPITLLGGPIITSEPEIIFKAIKPTIGVIGEAEETVVELLDVLKRKKDLKKVKGIIFSDSNKIIKTTPREPVKDLDTIPFPDYEDFGIKKQMDKVSTNFMFYTNFFDDTKMYPILASRSCPFQCTFCYHDSKYRRRSLDNVMQEIEFVVKKYHVNLLTIHDECFAVDKDRLIDFCKRISKLRKEINWDLKWSCQLRVETIDDKTIKMMKSSGCVVIGFGFESYSQEVLNSMKKNISPEKIDKALKLAFDNQMALQSFFIFGDIAETSKTAEETLKFWREKCKGQVGLGFIQPYPGSEIYLSAVKKGIIKDKLEFIKNLTVWNWFNMTDKMSNKQILELKDKVLDLTSKYTSFIRPNSVICQSNNKYQFNVTCPFCKKNLTYKNCEINNTYNYGFNLVCRECGMRFFVVSWIQKIAYANYSKVRALRDLQLKILRLIKTKLI